MVMLVAVTAVGCNPVGADGGDPAVTSICAVHAEQPFSTRLHARTRYA